MRLPRLLSLALIGLCSSIAVAQRQSPFTPVSLLPADAPMDEYSVTGDGARVYYSTVKGEIMLYDRKTSKTIRIADGGDVWDITVSKSGSAVAFTKASEDGKEEFIWAVPLDPATGVATGPQRRASMMPGDTPALSHDGRMLAFARDDSSGQSLLVLPTLGGPERVLATFPVGIGTIQWTPDGKTLFFSVNQHARNPLVTAGIQRISANGGTPRLVVGISGGSRPGLSPDGSLLAFPDSSSRRSLVVVDTNGRRVASYSLPLGFGVDTWTNGSVIVASRNRRPFREHMYSLADGSSRVAVDSSTNASWPSWSPDGKQFSFADRENDHSELVVMNRDGSSGRTIRLERFFGHGSVWSPNGRWALHYTAGMPPMAVAVEVATGKQVPVANPDGDIWGGGRWTDDSREVLLTIAQKGEHRTLTLRAFDLGGASRTLFEIAADPGTEVFPLDRKSAFVRRGADGPMMLESLDGGSKIQLLPPLPGFISAPHVSSDRQWVAFLRSPETNDNTRLTVLEVAKMDGSSHTSIELPFVVTPGAMSFLPGNRQVVVAEKPSPSPNPGVFLVTPATREIKKLFSIPLIRQAYAHISLSPDGKSILYTSRDSLPPGYATLDVSHLAASKR